MNRSHCSFVKSDGHSFVKSDGSNMLLGIKRGKTVKTYEIYFFLSKSLVFCERESDSLIKKSNHSRCSLVKRDKSDSLMVALI